MEAENDLITDADARATALVWPNRLERQASL